MNSSPDRSTLAAVAIGTLAIACCALPALLAVGAGTVLVAVVRFWPLTLLGAILLGSGAAWFVGVRFNAKSLGSKLVAMLKAVDCGLTRIGSQCGAARPARPPAQTHDQQHQIHTIEPAAFASRSTAIPDGRSNDKETS